MIDRLVQLSLQYRPLVLAAAVALTVLGSFRAQSMPIDVFPDVSSPRVTILTEAPGLAPVEVERLVTYPIESIVNGTSGVRRMRSASSSGLSIIWLDFDWDTAGPLARQRITERLRSVQLPPEARAPYLTPASSVMAEIAFVALRADPDRAVDPLTLRHVAEVEVRRSVLAAPGIAEVTLIGGFEREYQVLLDDERLSAFALSAADVAEAVERGSLNAPGGYLTERGNEAVVRVLGRATNAEEIGAIAIARRDDIAVRVRDVADVRVGPAVRRGAGGYNAQDAVVLGVLKQPNADTLDATEALDRTLDDLEASLLERGIRIERESFRQAAFIERATSNLFDALLHGALLVGLVLVLFLWSAGPTVVSVTALPLSLITATLLLDAFGLTLNTMTLGGLAIAMGELVDDAIVDVENVTRRLRERQQLPESSRPSVLSVVLKASLEVRPAIVSATLVIGLVFAPLIFLGGFEGRLLRPLALAYLVAIGASLLVALTVTPALASLLCRNPAQSDPPLQRWIERRYAPVLSWALRRPSVCVAITLVCVVLGAFALTRAGRGFLPEMNEGSATITIVGRTGTSLEDANELGRLAEEAILESDDVRSVTRRTGRATHDEHVLGPETTELEVLFRDEPGEAAQALRERLADLPGALSFGQPIGHRIDHMLHGQKAALTVRVVGEELDDLRRVARRVGEAMQTVRGVVDAQVEPIINVPQLRIDIDESSAARYGLSRGEAAREIGSALWGREVGHVFEHGAATPIVVRYPDGLREDRQQLSAARIATPSGALVPVGTLATLRDDRTPNYVMRENAHRRIAVTANIVGSDLASVAEAVREKVDRDVERPAGVRLEHAGRFVEQARASSRLLALGALAILGIVLVVWVTLRSARRTLIVLANLPLALVGGVAGVFLAGSMSLATTIGFITLFGIATRNGLLLATRVGELESSLPWREAVTQGARQRLAPILMTAITAALGLLPLGLSLGDPGAEIQAPMALVVLTGLATSTVLNMLVVPSLLLRWGSTRPAS